MKAELRLKQNDGEGMRGYEIHLIHGDVLPLN